jgi:cation transport protein ChaC
LSDVSANSRQLTREDFTAERVKLYAAMMRQRGMPEPMSEQERERSRRTVLEQIHDGEDLWLFGYGSLMWNPAITVAESQIARISDYTRRFCLTLSLGRGIPEKPGLMLALDYEPGAACAGIAHRILNRDLDSETKILWYREMISGAYSAQWLKGELADGSEVRMLSFVVRRDHARYEKELAQSEQVRRIAEAEGILGTNRDYLYRTAEFLISRKLAEEWIVKLADDVRNYRIQQGELP